MQVKWLGWEIYLQNASDVSLTMFFKGNHSMVSIAHRIGIRSNPQSVYAALTTLTGLSAWWTEDVEGISSPGETILFRFRKPNGDFLGQFGMKVQELAEATLVRWECVDGPEEWLGTEIKFQLAPADDQTIVLIQHNHWRERSEFMGHCSMKWATFMLSLREYVETGTGQPSPNDLKIDNWN